MDTRNKYSEIVNKHFNTLQYNFPFFLEIAIEHSLIAFFEFNCPSYIQLCVFLNFLFLNYVNSYFDF